MDFFDNAVNKAKEVFDVAYKKTNEVVNTQKQKFDIASVENKRAKDYEALGMLYFNMIKDSDNLDDAVKSIVEEIKIKNEKIAELRGEINNAKNKRVCPKCNANISKDSTYCSVCGAKLSIDSEENE